MALVVILLTPVVLLRMPTDIFPEITSRSSAWSGAKRAVAPRHEQRITATPNAQ